MTSNPNSQNPTNIISLRNDITTLIKPDDIKIYCAVSANVQNTHFIPAIINAQDLKIKEILGTTLYDDLVDQFESVAGVVSNLPTSGVTTGINYFELYQQIYKPLIFWSYFYAVPMLSIKMEEKGIMLNSSEYGENAGISAMKEMEARARKNAENYTEILHCYIKTTFKDNDSVVNESKNEGGYFSGIFYPSKIKNKKCSCNNINKLF